MSQNEQLKAELVVSGHARYLIVYVASATNPDRVYKVDVTNHRCECPAWTFQKGQRLPCKHLRSLGITGEPHYVPVPKAQAKTAPAKVWLTADQLHEMI